LFDKLAPQQTSPMLEILGRSTSINVRKVLWACVEIGLPYRHTEWGAGQLSLRDPAFLALNPNALVPVIRDGDFVLWESNTICRYLATQAGRGDLLPAPPAARARVEQWMDWQATELNTAWRHAFMGLVRKSPAFADPALIDASRQAWNRHMALLDEVLRGTGAFVTGSSFTLADVVLGLATNRWFMTPMARPDLPAVSAYYDRLDARPGFRAHGRNGMP
jgi:glutathione S-transferase